MQELQHTITTTLDKQLPMVVYRKPGTTTVSLIIQEDQQLHQAIDFSEQGFVFAPFDKEDTHVLIPLDASTTHHYDINEMGLLKTPPSEPDTETSTAKATHIQLVSKGIAAIRTSELQKVVLSRKHILKTDQTTPETLFIRLLHTYPNAMVYLWFHPVTGIWLGATPETLLQASNTRFKTMALAGTQAYAGSLTVDWGTKERDEQQLVTDEIAHRLTPLSTQIEVGKASTYKAGNLLHLCTLIQGNMETSQSLKNVIEALHPTPAVCGLPKEKAKDFIIQEEGYDRRYYTGFFGELNIPRTINRAVSKRNTENNAYKSIKKETHLFVNLRCMEFDKGTATLYVGGGITAASIPVAEWEETVRKTETMSKVL